MLVTEIDSNGRKIVKFRRDWWPGRMGLAYVPKLRNHVGGETMLKLQAALLRKDKR